MNLANQRQLIQASVSEKTKITKVLSDDERLVMGLEGVSKEEFTPEYFGPCFNCNKIITDYDWCFGCSSFICQTCNVNGFHVSGQHLKEDHLKKET